MSNFDLADLRTILHAGKRVQLSERGEGEPAFVLLAGLGDPASWWFRHPGPQEAQPHWHGTLMLRVGLASRLAATSRVAAYDRAGVGGSEAPDDDRSWAELFGELQAMLNALELTRPPTLVGHSLGGLIAWAFARQFPGQVGGLVLLDPTPPPTSPKPHGDSPERLALKHFEVSDLDAGTLGDLPLLLIGPGYTPPQDKGRFYARRSQHERLIATSSRGQAVWTSDTGHYVHLDTTLEVTEAVLDFWRRLSATPR
ncbi:alpha/beta hydrolase [Deinococcus sp.]|uniref:alpha/beta fold hydrolase n=1 Tax=Deinococcus sp. TaxID=47478 RepID=UPI0025DAF798|nr:alpha/beta hydrolase [Deinococcus sp.]